MSKRILLIDSDESFAQGLQEAIAARGFTAITATNSEQGMTLAKQDSPDLIVVCVEAQPTNGYMLCTRLKKDEQLKGIPVILTSANATADSFEKHKKLKTRAEEYLIKPFLPQTLLEKVAGLLGVVLPPETVPMEEEIVSVEEDEPLGLGDLVSGEDEPIRLTDSEAAEAHEAPPADDGLVVEEVEEVVQVTDEQAEEAPPEQSHDDDLKMFDDAFDALGPAAAASARPEQRAAEDDKAAFAGLRLAPPPAPEPEAALQVSDDTQAEQPAEAQAEAPSEVDSILAGEIPAEFAAEVPAEAGLDLGPTALGVDPDAHAALEARLQELEAELAARTAEVETARKGGGASSAELLKVKEARNRQDKEILRLKEELHGKEKDLHAKDTELLEVQEQQAALEAQAQQLKDDTVKREAAAKALQQRAEALAAAAKKFERELGSAREELKQLAGLKAKAAELEKIEKSHGELQKKHAGAAAEAEEHKSRATALGAEIDKHKGRAAELETKAAESENRASELDTELAGARALHETEVDQYKAELDTLKGDMEKLEQQLNAAQDEVVRLNSEATTSKDELNRARGDLAALTGERDLLTEEREDLRRQLDEASASASRNEERAVKAYQRIKGDERLREKTKKALQIALQLLDEVPAAEDPGAEMPAQEKQSA